MNKDPYIFFGSAPIGPIALEILRKAHYEPDAIIDDPKISLEDQLDIIDQIQPTFILVVGYGAILKREVIESVSGQILNIHPSLLPEYRGPAPVVQAILDGATETGITLMEIDKKMDHGKILAQKTIKLKGDENANDLYAILTQKGVELFLDNIEDYLAENIDLIPQNHSEATFTHFIDKNMGELDMNVDSVINERKIRALVGWPRTWVTHHQKRLLIDRAHIEKNELILDTVQPEGKKPMPLDAYLNGLRIDKETFYKELKNNNG